MNICGKCESVTPFLPDLHDQRCIFSALLVHLNANKLYYYRSIWLAEDQDARAVRLNDPKMKNPIGEGTILNAIENRILGVYGDHVAFPIKGSTETTVEYDNGRKEIVKVSTAKLASLPVRGVFAEAKLGHCNSCEETDITRFWDWQKSPCERPPEISPITGVTPHPEKPVLEPTSLPSSIVNIVNPPAAPDPTAMAGAMALLGKSEIFRDMSVSQEVSALLQKLASGAISGAQAQEQAKKLTSSSGSGATGTGGSTSPSSSSARPSPSDQHDQLQVYRNAEDHGEYTSDKEKAAGEKFLDDVYTAEKADKTTVPSDVVIDILTNNDSDIRSFYPSSRDKIGKIGIIILDAIAKNIPSDAKFLWSSPGSSVTFADPSLARTAVYGDIPGITDISFSITDSAGKTLTKTSTKLSVPQFIVIRENAAEFDKQLDYYDLKRVKIVLLEKVKAVVDKITSKVNVRTIWQIGPFSEPIPSHLTSSNYSVATILGLNATTPTRAGATGGAVGTGSFTPNESIDIWPGGYLHFGSDVGKDVVDIVKKIRAMISTDPRIMNLWIEIMSRLIGETIAHEIHHAVLDDGTFDAEGHNKISIPGDLLNRGLDRSFYDRTGIGIMDLVKFPAPGTYVDEGISVIKGLGSANQAKLDKYFPIPPAFS